MGLKVGLIRQKTLIENHVIGLNFSLSIWTALTVWRVMSFLICSIRVKIPEIRYILCDKIYWRYRLKWNWLNGTRSSCFISSTVHVGVASCVGGLQYCCICTLMVCPYNYVKQVVNPKISGWLGFGIFWSILVGIGVFMFRFHKLKYSSNHAILAKLMDAVSLENLGMLLIVFSIGVVLLIPY